MHESKSQRLNLSFDSLPALFFVVSFWWMSLYTPCISTPDDKCSIASYQYHPVAIQMGRRQRYEGFQAYEAVYSMICGGFVCMCGG